MHCVYLITNNTNNKKYVGVSVNHLQRFKNHISCKSALSAAIKKYGIESFALKVLFYGSEEYCYSLEDSVIEKYFSRINQNGYNIAKGGKQHGGRKIGLSHSNETKEKMKTIQKDRFNNYPVSQKTKEKISKALKGLKRNEEAI